MAVTRRNSKTTKATSNTTSKQKTEPKQPAPAPLNQRAHHPKRGAKAAAVEIEAILSHQALLGNTAVRETLLNLNHKTKSTKSTAKKRRGLTLAQRLALEPPWQEEHASLFPPQTEPQSNLRD